MDRLGRYGYYFPRVYAGTLHTLSLRQFLMNIYGCMGGCINTIIICWKGHSEAHSVVNTTIIVILSYLFLSQLLDLELFLTREIIRYSA